MEIKSKTSGKIQLKLKYEIFLQRNTKETLLGLLNFGSCPNYMSSANAVAEIQFKLLIE